jgi:hypothetical protein
MARTRSLMTSRLQVSAAGYPVAQQRDRPAGQDPRAALVLGAEIAATLALAMMIALLGAKLALLAIVVVSLMTMIALHPPIAAYALIGITPLVAGINRGAAVPALRPSEVLVVIAGVALCGRAIVRLPATSWPRVRVSRLDVAILLLAVTSSIIPLAWLSVRVQPIERDDVLYSLMVWKYYAVFLIFRSALRSPRQVRICLWIAMAAAALVAVFAIVESLQLFGIKAFLAKHYAPYGNVTAVSINRGGSTLGLPIAVADLLTLNLAIAIGLLNTSRRRPLLLGLVSLFVIGVFAAGEFSGVLALVVGTVAIAVATRRIRYLAVLPAAAAAAAIALRPVIDRRLQGFQSTSGLPKSWEGRLQNLQNYFFPQLFSHEHWLLGVRPAARVASSKLATGYIWIESGYTWLLWAGGVPLLLSFFYFLCTGGREALVVLRTRTDALGAAALAVVVGLSVDGVLMILDPHLTYRGAADLLFALLGITAAAHAMPTAARRS